jgi:hypothetical protein
MSLSGGGFFNRLWGGLRGGAGLKTGRGVVITQIIVSRRKKKERKENIQGPKCRCVSSLLSLLKHTSCPTIVVIVIPWPAACMVAVVVSFRHPASVGVDEYYNHLTYV